MKLLANKRKLLLLLIDFVIFSVVYLLTVLLQAYSPYDKMLSAGGYMLNCAIFYVCILASRILFNNYSNVLRYADSKVYVKMLVSDAVGGVFALAVTRLIEFAYLGLWISTTFICLDILVTISSRLFYQERTRQISKSESGKNRNKIGVAIIGAGKIGALLCDELIYNGSSHYVPICFVDQNKDKIGSMIHGIKVLHNDNTVIDKIRALPIQEIFIAINDLDGDKAKSLFEFYSKTGCKVKLYDLPISEYGKVYDNSKRVIREVKIEDLLFRSSMKMENIKTKEFYKDKVVLVTGGGGSIGSELCRQIAACRPGKLIIFDIYENNAYQIQQELIQNYGSSLDLFVEIGSVRDVKRLEAVFNYYKPDIVFHAAAHKHVPLMEHSNCEAIKNNVIGTYNTANLAEKYGVEKFILISTDKAVNPTNIMGASKRMCEMVIQCRTDSRTTFSAVRFGNVLGSNGSVIPLFKKQIEKGGPVTVTDKRIIRYFMTIPEASSLVMEAGAMAKSNELFILDMGNPVKIYDLAENMIKLSGLVPYRDIDIIETGLRPGEKLYEELLIQTEKLDKTSNNMIFVERDTPYTRAEIEEKINILKEAVMLSEREIQPDLIRDAMMRVVPTYKLPDEVNAKAESSKEMSLVS